MKKILTLLSFCLLLFLNPTSLFASHLMGGEITWTAIKSGPNIGKFQFQVKLYRDCSGILPPGSVTLTTNAPGWAGGILCNSTLTTDISPVGPGCPTCAAPANLPNAVQEVIYISSPIIITGVPPATGWYFYYNDCCRNAAITNLSSAGSGSFTMRAIMYPYNSQNTNPAFDNSAQFLIRPTLACSIGDTVQYSQGAFDTDLDSLSFNWDHPLDGNGLPGTNYPFATGYSYNSPFPGTSQNPVNIPATINPTNGIISFLSYTQGVFVYCIKVTSWKCGQKTSEIYRETQIAAMNNCFIPFTPPVRNISPDITIYKNGNAFTQDVDTLESGDSLQYIITASDNQMLADTITPQTVTLSAISPEFGTNFTDTINGCLIPPCATLNIPSPTYGATFTSNIFNWKTSCAHSGWLDGCLKHTRSFLFTFKANDDFCPSQGIRSHTIEVVVRGHEIYTIGDSLAISLSSGSSVTVQWYLNGIAISGATDTIYYPTQSGVYSVIETSQTGCQDLSNAVYKSMTGINKLSSSEWKMNAAYENTGNINIVILSPLDLQSEIQITDSKGSSIYNKTLRVQSGPQHIIINPGFLSAGIYFITLNNSSTKLSSKIIVTSR